MTEKQHKKKAQKSSTKTSSTTGGTRQDKKTDGETRCKLDVDYTISSFTAAVAATSITTALMADEYRYYTSNTGWFRLNAQNCVPD